LGYRVQLRYSGAVARSQLTQAEVLFRKLLKDLRQAKGLTQTQLAARVDLPQSYVSKYEAGERRLDFIETFFLCKALEISIEDFTKMFTAELGKTGRKKRG
jgi:transcriptional regulator with XRE-family HTH domain